MHIHNRLVTGMIAVAAVLGIVSDVQAATYYWDNNGTTLGFGTPASGTWAAPTTGNSSQGWSTDETGGTVPGNVTTTTSDTLYFGTDVAGLGAGTITVSGTVSGRNIYFGSLSGAITLSGGTITMFVGGGANSGTITVNNVSNSVTGTLSLGGGGGETYHTQGSGALVLGILNASGGSKILSVEGGPVTVGMGSGGISYNGRIFTKAGGGTLVLSGAGTSATGTFELKDGTVVINNKSAFGSGILQIAQNAITPVIQASQDFIGANAITASSFFLNQQNANPTFSGNYSIEIAGTNSQRNSHTIYNNIVAGKLLILNTVSLTGATGYGNAVLTIDGAGNTTINGVVYDGAGGTGGLTKAGTGALTLSGSNTFTGAITVNAGALALSGTNAPVVTTTVGGGILSLTGAAGSLAACTNLALSGGGTLKLDNTTAANNTDRLKDTATVSMNGATFFMSNDASANNFSETVGALTIAAGINSLTNSQAQSGYSNTLTFASLAWTGGAVNFSGAGLGVDGRNRIMFTTPPTLNNGIIGTWALYNGSGYATYDPVRGVVAYAASYVDIAARGPGSTISDGSTTYVRINSPGTSGNIELGSTMSTVFSLLQNTTTPAMVNTAGKVFRTSGIMINSGMEAVTIGASALDGALLVASPGGTLSLVNNSTNTLTINACITNNTSASGLNAVGNVTLNGTNGYTGTTSINNGFLTFGSAFNQTLASAVVGDGGLVKTGAGTLTLASNGNYTGDTVIKAGTLKMGGTYPKNNYYLGDTSGGLAATLTLSATLTAGNIIVQGGGTGVSTINSAGFNLTAPITLGSSGQAHDLTINQTLISGTMQVYASIVDPNGLSGSGGSVTISAGSGFVKLYNASTFGGETRFKDGQITFVNQYALQNSTLNLIDSATLGYTTGQAVTLGGLKGTSNLASGNYTFTIGNNNKDTSYSGVLSGATPLTKIGTGTLTLGGANTYGGVTTISNGFIAVSNNLAMSTNVVTLSGGGIAGAGGSWAITNVINLSNSATFDTTGSLALMGPVTNSGALTKIGGGTLTLAGTNTYRGGTTVSNGMLIVNGSVTGTLVVAGGTLGGTGVVVGTVTNFATIGAIDTSTIGMLTVSNLVMKPNSSYAWNYTTSDNTKVYVNGNLSLPTVVTVNVTKVSGQLPNQGVLFSGFSNAISTDLSGWVITGTPTKARAKVMGNQIVLQTLQGTLISFQ